MDLTHVSFDRRERSLELFLNFYVLCSTCEKNYWKEFLEKIDFCIFLQYDIHELNICNFLYREMEELARRYLGNRLKSTVQIPANRMCLKDEKRKRRHRVLLFFIEGEFFNFLLSYTAKKPHLFNTLYTL